jgi:hypothetical protein
LTDSFAIAQTHGSLATDIWRTVKKGLTPALNEWVRQSDLNIKPSKAPKKSKKKTTKKPKPPMAKKNQNQKKKKQAKNVPKIPRPMQGGGGKSMSVERAVIDEYGYDPTPFGSRPLIRWPDGTSLRTVPMRVSWHVPFGVNSDSTLRAVQLLPRLASPIYKGPVWSPGTPTVFPITGWGTGTGYTAYTTLAANFDRFRIACWGVEVRSVGRQDAQAGVVTVLTGTDDQAGVLSNPDDFAFHSDSFPVKQGVVCRWVSAPLGSDAHTFYPVDSTASPEMYNWTYPVMFATGCSSDVVLEAEVVMQVEMLPKEKTITAMLLDRGHLERIAAAAAPIASQYGQKAVDMAMAAAIGSLSMRANRYFTGATAGRGGAAPAA